MRPPPAMPMLLLNETGSVQGRREASKDPDGKDENEGVVGAPVFSLFDGRNEADSAERVGDRKGVVQ